MSKYIFIAGGVISGIGKGVSKDFIRRKRIKEKEYE